MKEVKGNEQNKKENKVKRLTDSAADARLDQSFVLQRLHVRQYFFFVVERDFADRAVGLVAIECCVASVEVKYFPLESPKVHIRASNLRVGHLDQSLLVQLPFLDLPLGNGTQFRVAVHSIHTSVAQRVEARNHLQVVRCVPRDSRCVVWLRNFSWFLQQTAKKINYHTSVNALNNLPNHHFDDVFLQIVLLTISELREVDIRRCECQL